MENLVTIGLPIYKRLQYLPRVLKAVAAQDYSAIELLVSDNGLNGPDLPKTVESLYSRPFKFRRNERSVEAPSHFNQMLQAASGEYFVWLADDDEISPNFASELVAQFQRHPKATIGLSRQEIVAESGELLGKSIDVLPDVMSGPEFIVAVWQKYAFGFQSLSTYLGKRREMIDSGGYPSFTRGTHSDDAMVLRLALRGDVVFSSKCLFRNLVQESSLGWAMTTRELAAAVREFMRFLDEDATTQQFSAAHPEEWERLRDCMRRMSWGMYLSRWKGMYRKRLSFLQWSIAAFRMPLIRDYYRQVGRALVSRVTGG